MTNAEKFKEVFGFFPDVRPDEAICNSLDCGDARCEDCKFCSHFDPNGLTKDVHTMWSDEYIGGKYGKND